ncbi:MAG: hypothetical protein RR817_09860, partial [Niameybacter sp.]
HKIVPGSVDHSYGIQVAHLAGLPKEVLNRAHAIMAEIEGDSSKDLRNVVEASSKVVEAHKAQPNLVQSSIHVASDVLNPENQIVTPRLSQSTQVGDDVAQLSLFGGTAAHYDIIDALESADLMNMTPFEAMQLLFELKNQLKESTSKNKKSKK